MLINNHRHPSRHKKSASGFLTVGSICLYYGKNSDRLYLSRTYLNHSNDTLGGKPFVQVPYVLHREKDHCAERTYLSLGRTHCRHPQHIPGGLPGDERNVYAVRKGNGTISRNE